MTFSKACIYNPEHPKFNRMQELIEILKRPDLLTEKRNKLKAERTKLSLFEPDKYDELFSLSISKEISAIRLNFFSRELQVYDVSKKLGFIVTPTLIMFGRYDVHYPFLEESERFVDEYKLFIKEQP